MKWDTVVQIVLMIGLLVAISANLRLRDEREDAILIAAIYRTCLDANISTAYCEEFVFPAVIEEMNNE